VSGANASSHPDRGMDVSRYGFLVLPCAGGNLAMGRYVIRVYNYTSTIKLDSGKSPLVTFEEKNHENEERNGIAWACVCMYVR
jgi:hypothetical protein